MNPVTFNKIKYSNILFMNLAYKLNRNYMSLPMFYIEHVCLTLLWLTHNLVLLHVILFMLCVCMYQCMLISCGDIFLIDSILNEIVSLCFICLVFVAVDEKQFLLNLRCTEPQKYIYCGHKVEFVHSNS